jgi:hypothetical protein
VSLEGEVGQLLRARIGAKHDVGIHEQGVRMLLRDHRELREQLFGGAHVGHLQSDTQARRGLLAELQRVRRSFRVLKKHDPRDLGNRLLEELEALRAELRGHAGHTGQISTGPSEARDVLEWIARIDDERCGLDRCRDDARRPRAHGEQHVDRSLHELGGQPGQAVVSAIGESLLQDEVLSLDVALFRQACPEDIEMGAPKPWAADLQPAHARYPGSPWRLDPRRPGEQAHDQS